MSGDAAPKVDQLKSFLAGGAAGISAVLVGVCYYPIIYQG
jgi:hypothetical protein